MYRNKSLPKLTRIFEMNGNDRCKNIIYADIVIPSFNFKGLQS